MLVTITLAVFALVAVIANAVKDDEIKKLKYRIGYLEGKRDNIGNKRYK